MSKINKNLAHKIIDKMTSCNFKGRDAVRRQFFSSILSKIPNEESFYIETKCDELAHVNERVPIQAESIDLDGIPVYYLLHIENGRLSELEIYKADSSDLIDEPDPEKMILFN